MLNKSAFFGKRILTIKHVQGDPEITCYSMATTERYVKWPLCHHVCFSDPSNWLCYWSAGVRTDVPSPLRPDRLRGPSSILSSGSKGIAAERDVDTSSTEVNSSWSYTATTIRLNRVVPNRNVGSVRRVRLLRAATDRFVMSVRQSVWSYLARTKRMFYEIWFLKGFF